MSSIYAALVAALVYLIIVFIEDGFLSWDCLTRPIVVAPLTGLLLGDFHTGVVMGASLEAIFMGIFAIGGSLPANATAGSSIAVAYVILTGSSPEAGLAIAFPIGTLIASVRTLVQPFRSALAAYWEKLALEEKHTKFVVMNYIVQFLINVPGAVVIFLGVAFGAENLQAVLNNCPEWVMRGINASSSMMVAVGLAILCSMIWNGQIGCFFFIGYVLSKCIGLDSLSIAIIGIAIAITMFLQEKEIVDIKGKMDHADAASGQNNGEEDFF
ncbi:MAG: PTS mannose/fructose/sorbose/N-acetylgalactosamine transporter subunit IIC [Lachnospiraceae bacterium]